jgi:hypothetical protein
MCRRNGMNYDRIDGRVGIDEFEDKVQDSRQIQGNLMQSAEIQPS